MDPCLVAWSPSLAREALKAELCRAFLSMPVDAPRLANDETPLVLRLRLALKEGEGLDSIEAWEAFWQGEGQAPPEF